MNRNSLVDAFSVNKESRKSKKVYLSKFVLMKKSNEELQESSCTDASVIEVILATSHDLGCGRRTFLLLTIEKIVAVVITAAVRMVKMVCSCSASITALRPRGKIIRGGRFQRLFMACQMLGGS